jgi:hypothetical protein
MRKLVLLIAVLIGLTAPARTADDIAAAQKIISSQTEAMTRDDAAAAYGFAAPAIQGMFTDPDSFMAMVRNGYAPVYRHKTFEFGESSASGGKIQQKVHIIDADGVPWDALYTVEPQPDGSMKISSCVLMKVGQAV